MARAQDPELRRQPVLHHAWSEAPHLDGQYAAFGKVIEGMDVADAHRRRQDRDWNDKPK